MEDDAWMNPPTRLEYKAPPPKNGTFFQIQRKRATLVSGNVSHIYSWDVWEEFDDKEKRDAALANLREDHPAWHLRARSVTYIHGQIIGPRDPFEYADA